MQQMLTRKNIIWMIVITVTAWLTWQTYQQEQGVSVAEPVRAPVRTESYRGSVIGNIDAKAMTGSFELTLRVKETKPYFNLFSVPIKKIEKPAVNIEKMPVPTTPALPFKYIGVVTEVDQTKVILDYQGEVLAVKAGDNLGTNYKLVSINKAANSTELLFLFLPMNITQTMVVRDVSEH